MGSHHVLERRRHCLLLSCAGALRPASQRVAKQLVWKPSVVSSFVGWRQQSVFGMVLAHSTRRRIRLRKAFVGDSAVYRRVRSRRGPVESCTSSVAASKLKTEH